MHTANDSVMHFLSFRFFANEKYTSKNSYQNDILQTYECGVSCNKQGEMSGPSFLLQYITGKKVDVISLLYQHNSKIRVLYNSNTFLYSREIWFYLANLELKSLRFNTKNSYIVLHFSEH